MTEEEKKIILAPEGEQELGKIRLLLGRMLELLESQIGIIEHVVEHKRKVPDDETRNEHVTTIRTRGGMCPNCEQRSLFDQSGRFVGEIDHHEKASDASVDATWPVCQPCNRSFNREQRVRCNIESYHRYRANCNGPMFHRGTMLS